jgi:hypothetical protein
MESPVGAGPLILLDTPEVPASAYRGWRHLLLLRRSGETLVLHTAEGAALDEAPQATLAIVAAPLGPTPELAAWAAARRLTCPVIPHSDGLAALLASLAEQRRRVARGRAELMLELAELRIAHDDLAAGHAALVALLRDQGLLLPRLGFSVPPDPGGARLPATARRVEQPLGVDIRTLCGIALHLAGRLPQPGIGLDLCAADDDRPVAGWQVAAGTPPGWASFAFPARADLPAGTAALRLRWPGSAPPLSLGRPTLRPDLAAWLDGAATDRPLALRAFVSAPGAPGLVTQALWPARRPDGEAVTRIDLVLDDTLRPQDLRQLHRMAHFAPVALLADQRRILVHPLEALPTIACLPAICPPGTREVQARVTTANPAAGPIEYGLYVGTPPRDVANLAAQIAWTRLLAGEEALLRLELPAPLEAPADLLLLTRLPPDGTARAAWAHVTAIQLRGQFDAG